MTGTLWTKFFWSDWLSDVGLRRCSIEARGLWMDMLCVAAAHDPIGYVAVNGEALSETEIAKLACLDSTVASTLLSELDRNGVFSRTRTGMIYSRRMVRDEKKSRNSQKNGKLGGNPTLCNKSRKNTQDKGRHKPPDNQNPGIYHMPDTRGSVSSLRSDTGGTGPPLVDLKAELFSRGRSVLGKQSGGLIAKLLRHFGPEDDPKSIAKARAQIEEASTKTRPDEWIGRILSGKSGDGPVDWRSVL